MIHYIKEEIYFAAQSLNKEIMITYQEEKLLVFLEVSLKNMKESVVNFLDLVDRRLRSLLPNVVISWGIGNFNEGISNRVPKAKVDLLKRFGAQIEIVGDSQDASGERCYELEKEKGINGYSAI